MKSLLLLPLLFFLCCQNAKVTTYEQGLENCTRMLQENLKKDPSYFGPSPDCIIGAQIPEFEAITLSGKKINTEMLKGKPSVINFWFTTCAPCVAEIPGLNALVDKFGADKVNFIAIGRDDTNDVKEFLDQNTWNFEHIAGGKDLIQQKFRLLWGFPTTFLLDKSARIVQAFAGGKSDSTAVEEIQKKLTPAIEKEMK